MANDLFLYPSVTRVPGQIPDISSQGPIKKNGVPSEFDAVLDSKLAHSENISDEIKADFSKAKSPLKMSAHAMQRLNDRKIKLDQATMNKISDAVDKAASKGVEDTLVLTPEAALIVSVKNRTIITMMDRNSSEGNVFTNIDGAIVI